MVEKTHGKNDLLGLVSFAFFLIALGAIFATVPGLPGKIIEFFQSFRIKEVYPGTSFVAPTGNQSAIYGAAYTFSIIFGVSQIIVLAARFLIKDTTSRKAESLTGIIFWFGAAYGFSSLASGSRKAESLTGIIFWFGAAYGFSSLASGSLDWFVFLSWIVILAGISITVRSAVAFAAWGKN